MKDFKGQVIVVTGRASGIGFAFCKRFVKEGTKLILSDIHNSAATDNAKEIGAVAITANVGKEADIKNLIKKTVDLYGETDLFVSGAGIAFPADENTGEYKWDVSRDVNVMAHVYADRHAIPCVKQKGGGYLLNTVSAAGLMQEFHSASYTATKHAVLGLAEWMAAAYAKDGIRVSVMCPAGTATVATGNTGSLLKEAIEPGELVELTLKALAKEQFLISTHDFIQLKGTDFEKYPDTPKQ